MEGNADIHIGGGAWITVIGYGLAADEQVLTLMGAE
jgi:hypothetical protein